MKRILCSVLLVVVLLSALPFSASAADDFSTVLAQFPDSYKASLKELHGQHPNWRFQKVAVGKNFADCVNAEHDCRAKLNLVEVSSANDAKACPSSCANANYHSLVDGVYRCASYDYIAECMDPTNYLRESLIFQFENLGAKSYYTEEKIETALKSTSSFMYKKEYRQSAAKIYTYAKMILDASSANNVDALFIISRITNEVGSASPAKLAKGYAYEYEKGKSKTVYNFFNIGGNVSASAKYAYNHGWTNPKAALEGGIAFIAKNYVKAGQYTNYFQKFQVNPKCNYDFYTHQYMQGTDAVINESSYTYKNYNALGIMDKEHLFQIPVYENLSKVTYEAQDLGFKNASFSATYLYVNSQVSSSLAVRTKASSSEGSTTCRITRGTLLQKTGKTGLWYAVKVLNGTCKGSSGYVHGDYVSPASKIKVGKGGTVTLAPKLRISTCSYSFCLNSPADAVGIKDGVIYGKKIGTGVFKAVSGAGNIGYLEIECIGAVAAPAFTLVGGSKSVQLSWKAVEDASFYRVYLYNAQTKKHSRLAQTTALKFTHSSLAEGTKYTYLVRAFDVNAIGSNYTEKSNKSVFTLPAKPKFSGVCATDVTKLKWTAVKGATAYGIWSYNAATNRYTKLGNTKSTSYLVKNLKANTAYTYLVRSFNASGWSSFTRKDNVSVKTAPGVPRVQVSTTNSMATLSWNKCAGAAFYRVYTYNFTTGKYDRIAQTKALSFTHKPLKEGTRYVYLVRAFNAEEIGSSYTAQDNHSVMTLPPKPKFTLEAGTAHITLSWSAVKGATKYRIWTYDAETNHYTEIATTAETRYTFEQLSSNTRYTLLVRAYNVGGWSCFTREDNKQITTAPTAPAFSLKQTAEGVRISWSACAGAEKYKVYSFDPDSGKFTRIATIVGSYCLDKTAEPGIHYYLVRAVNADESASDYTNANIKKIEVK